MPMDSEKSRLAYADMVLYVFPFDCYHACAMAAGVNGFRNN